MQCGGCRFFTGTPAALERAIPGLNILSSAYGSVRGRAVPAARIVYDPGDPSVPSIRGIKSSLARIR